LTNNGKYYNNTRVTAISRSQSLSVADKEKKQKSFSATARNFA